MPLFSQVFRGNSGYATTYCRHGEFARIANGWSMNTDTVGVYGNYYLKRAILAQQGLGANLVEDAIYPLNLADGEGKPLDGSNRYVIRF